MKKDDGVYLRHVLDAIGKIEGYVQGVSVERFMSDTLIQDAVVRELEITGEAGRQLSESFRLHHPQVQWNALIGMRNRMIHAYFDLNIGIVWDIVCHDLPALKSNVKTFIDEVEKKDS